MRTQAIFFLTVFLSIFAGLNYYIGIRGWQAFGRLIPAGCGPAYWFVLALLAFSYLIGRFGAGFMPDALSTALTVLGSYWLAFMNFFVLLLIVVDLVRLVDRWMPFLPQGLKQQPAIVGLAVAVAVLGLVLYGSWNARNPQLTHYDVTIDKPAGSISRLHAVMVSDIHLGNIIHNGRFMALINRINSLNPDIVLLPGDIIDENIGPFVEQKMPESFRQLDSKYGVYAVFGNHEYIGGHAEEAYAYLQEAGVTVLRDGFQEISGSFNIAGRDDRSRARYGGLGRKELPEVLAGINRDLPVILLDHQPSHLEEAQEQGVDLQLSGHTHQGQLFPFNLITKRIFETDWGYLRKEDFQIIVSSGFGTWGPPIRIGNHPEIVDITIHFTGRK
ncbi:MAG: metallophosphoesterase [Desulfotomaculaceae bacterium]|nr:metallophosphoesterase [Desulfotomaculaceae bacterium]